MMGFGLYEFLSSSASALIYGAFFSLLSLFLDFLITVAKELNKFLPAILSTKKEALSKIKNAVNKNSGIESHAVVIFLKIVAFALGIVLLSYCLIDGVARAFLLVWALISYGATRICLKYTVEKRINSLAVELTYLTSVLLRGIFRPILFLIGFIVTNLHKLYKKVLIRQSHSLDKQLK